MPATPRVQFQGGNPGAKEVREAIRDFQRGIRREENFGILVERFYGPVFRFLARWTLSEQDRLDITQEVFLRVYKGLRTYRGDAEFGTWVFKIAQNTCMRWFSRGPHRLKTEPQPSPSGDPDDDELAAKAASFLGDPLEELIAKEKSELLRSAIADLPDQMRRCVELHIYQDLRYEEIARLLHLSPGTVKAHLFQAREKLRNRLPGALASENL